MTHEIERIRAALEDATYGPWTGAGPSFGKPLPEYLDSVVQDIDGDDCAPTICRDTETSDAEYIASCNPAAMTAVLAHIDQQAAEIESLRADAARYRWLRRKCVQLDLTHATVATLVKDQSELDAAMKETP